MRINDRTYSISYAESTDPEAYVYTVRIENSSAFALMTIAQLTWENLAGLGFHMRCPEPIPHNFLSETRKLLAKA